LRNRLAQNTPKEQSHLELIRDLKAAFRGQIDVQLKKAYLEFGLEYEEKIDKVKAFRTGKISIEDNYPAMVVYPITQNPSSEGEGISLWNYQTGIDGYLQAKKGIEETLDEKIIQFQVAAERILLGLFPGAGTITQILFADIIKNDALQNAFTMTYTMRVGKTYTGIPA